MKRFFMMCMVLALVISSATYISAGDTKDRKEETPAVKPAATYSVQIVITYHDVTTEDASILLQNAGKVFTQAQSIAIEARASQ